MHTSTVTNDSANQATIWLGRDASVRFRGGNTITNNGTGPLITIVDDSSMRSDNTQNPTPDVYNGRIFMRNNSTLTLREATISVSSGNAIRAENQSVIDPNSTVTVNGHISCSGNSLLTNDNLLGTNTVGCSNFVVDGSNSIGIGTRNPTVPLHVLRDEDASVLVQNTTATTAQRELFAIENAGNTRFAIENTDVGVRWLFLNSAIGTFRISDVENPNTIELNLDQEGNLTIAGILTENSSREVKHAIADVNTQQVLDKVLSLPIEEWTYKEGVQVRHMGPMAEDFYAAFSLGQDDKGISTLDTSGVALAAIQGLHERHDTAIRTLTGQLHQKDAEINKLRKEKDAQINALKEHAEKLRKGNEALGERIAALETAVLSQRNVSGR
jgi:hypothetical protein